MKKISIRTPAKINLYLHITGKTQSNYHLLDSLVCFLPDLYDTITIEETEEPKHVIEVKGLWSKEVTGQNIIEKTLEEISPFLNKRFHIILEKNIPVGAGLGGGSGNAAFLFLHILDKYKITLSEKEILPILSELGSDVPLFKYNKALFALGTGNVIRPIQTFPQGLGVLIVYPNKMLNTKIVYETLSLKPRNNIKHHYCPSISELLELLKTSDNDLYSSSKKLLPELDNILEKLVSLEGCVLARMSGSGSASFGLFINQNKLDLAEVVLRKMLPSFFITKSRIE